MQSQDHDLFRKCKLAHFWRASYTSMSGHSTFTLSLTYVFKNSQKRAPFSEGPLWIRSSHIMICHDMSWYIMINYMFVMSCHVILSCHQISSYAMKCHQVSSYVMKGHHVKLKDILWHLMTWTLCEFWWHLMIFHDISYFF